MNQRTDGIEGYGRKPPPPPGKAPVDPCGAREEAGPEEHSRFRWSAEIPSLPLTSCQGAASVTASGIRVRSKLVPAGTELNLPHPLHSSVPLRDGILHNRHSRSTRIRLATEATPGSRGSQRQGETTN